MKNKIRLLPFWFKNFDDDVLLVNQCGDFLFISREDFGILLRDEISKNSDLYFKLKGRLILADEEDLNLQTDFIANQLRTRKSFLKDFTSLHMIVVTCRCNFRCEYCHASSAAPTARKQDMTWKVAKKVVEKFFDSPSPNIKIEFQGGEPLLNWQIICEIVEYAEILNRFAKRNLEFVICTNLTLADRKILEYCKRHKIFISTSMDGDAEIQNANRKPRDKNVDGYGAFIEGLNLAREILGEDSCSPLLTVTKTNLNKLPQVVDSYIKLNFHGVFIRELNPYGYAEMNLKKLGYSTDEFVDAYKKALDYIIEQNLRGKYFVEYFAALLLQRILTSFPTGFVDLQSPCGDVIGGAIYDYDGNVYAADEGRMLARTGDKKFLLGNVLTDEWKEIFAGEKAREIVKVSCLETLPECAFCAYQMYCGASPVRYYTESGDFFGRRATSNFCKKIKGIVTYLFELLRKNDTDVNDVFWSWITERSLRKIRGKNA